MPPPLCTKSKKDPSIQKQALSYRRWEQSVHNQHYHHLEGSTSKQRCKTVAGTSLLSFTFARHTDTRREDWSFTASNNKRGQGLEENRWSSQLDGRLPIINWSPAHGQPWSTVPRTGRNSSGHKPEQSGCALNVPGLNCTAKAFWRDTLEKNKSPVHTSLLFWLSSILGFNLKKIHKFTYRSLISYTHGFSQALVLWLLYGIHNHNKKIPGIQQTFTNHMGPSLADACSFGSRSTSCLRGGGRRGVLENVAYLCSGT